jgi:dTDP-4-dehydrorhamnose reductase
VNHARRLKVLVTGLNGTLAPRLAEWLMAQGHEVLAWNRHAHQPADEAAGRTWLDTQDIGAVAHLAMGDAHWAGWLAWWAAQRGLPYVFTSTAMVFHHLPDGPHLPDDERTAQDDYGRSKIDCEDAILRAYPQASVARIGWQIDLHANGPKSNTMLRTLDDWQAKEGRVAASCRWRPACSFMDDTVAALAQLLLQPRAGVLHLDSNAQEAWRFDQIAAALAQAAQRNWRVEPVEGYAHDQRLQGTAMNFPNLSARLPALAALDQVPGAPC